MQLAILNQKLSIPEHKKGIPDEQLSIPEQKLYIPIGQQSIPDFSYPFPISAIHPGRQSNAFQKLATYARETAISLQSLLYAYIITSIYLLTH